MLPARDKKLILCPQTTLGRSCIESCKDGTDDMIYLHENKLQLGHNLRAESLQLYANRRNSIADIAFKCLHRETLGSGGEIS